LTKLLKPSFDDKKLKNNLQLGNLRSTGVKETATPSYQTTSRLQRFATKPMEHFSNIYSLPHPIRYYRAAAAASFTRMQQLNNPSNKDDKGPAPKDVGEATWTGKGKSKGKKLHHKGTGKQRYKGKRHGIKGKGKQTVQSHWTGKSIQRPKNAIRIQQRKRTRKDSGQQGHIAGHCRVAIYNYDMGDQSNKADPKTTGTTTHNSMIHLGGIKTSHNRVI
jgi:hypothetical protein